MVELPAGRRRISDGIRRRLTHRQGHGRRGGSPSRHDNRVRLGGDRGRLNYVHRPRILTQCSRIASKDSAEPYLVEVDRGGGRPRVWTSFGKMGATLRKEAESAAPTTVNASTVVKSSGGDKKKWLEAAQAELRKADPQEVKAVRPSCMPETYTQKSAAALACHNCRVGPWLTVLIPVDQNSGSTARYHQFHGDAPCLACHRPVDLRSSGPAQPRKPDAAPAPRNSNGI